MTTLGTHPFIPSASKIGAPIHCQQCSHDAAHPVHDWLSPNSLTDILIVDALMSRITLSDLLADPKKFDLELLTGVQIANSTGCDGRCSNGQRVRPMFQGVWGPLCAACALANANDDAEDAQLSAITPEEMVQLQNLPNGEPFEDVGGYCQRAGR